MPSEVIAVFGTLSGAVVVGLISYFSNRSSKNHEWRLALARDQVASRQKLYAEFLVEAQHFVTQARESRAPSLTDLNALNAKHAEVCLIAPQCVIQVAKKLSNYAITSYTAQPAKEAANFKILKEEFISAAREDIDKILSEA